MGIRDEREKAMKMEVLGLHKKMLGLLVKCYRDKTVRRDGKAPKTELLGLQSTILSRVMESYETQARAKVCNDFSGKLVIFTSSCRTPYVAFRTIPNADQ